MHIHKHERLSISALLLTVMFLSTSCGIIVPVPQSDTETAETTAEQTPPETTAPETTADIPIRDADRSEEYQAYADAYLERVAQNGLRFDGQTFFIATPRGDVLHPSDTDSTYSAAIYRRNQAVESALNVRLAPSVTDEGAYFDLLSASILADEYFADLLLVPQNQIGIFAAGDTLMNLRSAPMLDLAQPYYFPDSIEAGTAGSQIFAAAGSASFEPTSLSAVFFNRGLFIENGVDIPYESVYDGTWTWDAFFASCSQVNGINQYAEANRMELFSSYATQYAADALPAMIFASGGREMVRSVTDVAPLVVLSEAESAVFDIIHTLYDDVNAHRDTNSGVSRFHTGKSLYLLDRLYLMSWMPDSKQSWGILPLPKMTEEQPDHITLTDGSALFFAIQKNAVDAARSATVMSALNAASYGILEEAYVAYSMNHLLRDNDSANMLSLILASRAYDFALAFENSVPYLASATTEGLKDLAKGLSASSLLSRENAADTQLARRYPAVETN